MINAEKYLKEGVDLCELIRNIADYKPKLETSDNVYAKMQEFFKQQVQPTLTEDERVILRNIDKRYKYIGRTDYNARMQYLYVNIEDDWKPATLDPLDHLFQFIKERRRI